MASLTKDPIVAKDYPMSKFLYTILKQYDLKAVNWQEVADDLEISNGHAARMRFSRFKKGMEGPVPEKPKKVTEKPAMKKQGGFTGEKKRKGKNIEADDEQAKKKKAKHSITIPAGKTSVARKKVPKMTNSSEHHDFKAEDSIPDEGSSDAVEGVSDDIPVCDMVTAGSLAEITDDIDELVHLDDDESVHNLLSAFEEPVFVKTEHFGSNLERAVPIDGFRFGDLQEVINSATMVLFPDMMDHVAAPMSGHHIKNEDANM